MSAVKGFDMSRYWRLVSGEGRPVNRRPQQQCTLCGRVEIVKPDGRGFPPDIAKRRLVKECRLNGCPCDPQYTAGIALAPPRAEQ